MTASLLAVSLVVAHFVGDWFCQTRQVALNKTKYVDVLLKHLFIVGCFVATPVLLLGHGDLGLRIVLLLVYVILHGAQDWNIWRLYEKGFYNPRIANSDNNWWYRFLAIDQMLHLSLLMVMFIPFT